MKILQVPNCFKYAWEAGGVTRVAYDLSRYLVKRGHEVTVFATEKGLPKDLNIRRNHPVMIDGVETYYFRNASNYLAERAVTIPYYSPFVVRKRLKEFDIIHTHEYRRVIVPVIYHHAKKYGVPYVLQAHGSLPRSGGMVKQRLKLIYDVSFGYRLLRDASKVIAVTRMEAEQYRDIGVPKEKIVVIPNGIDLSEYEDLPPRGFFRAKYGIGDSKKVILYLGRIHEIKGIGSLIKAYAHLVKSVKFDDVLLVIVGPDYGYLSEAKSMVNSFKINDGVVFTGPIYGMGKLEAYVDADVYVLPSRYETFPATVLEAMACGMPIILSENCGIAEVIKTNGARVIRPSPEGIQAALLKLLTDEELAKKMGERGRRFVFENYDWKNIVPRFEALYQSAMRFKE